MSSSEQGVLRSSAVMAVGTIASRITGLLRDIVITAALGFAILRDLYNLGNSLPNVIYILVAGGALNAVFIPQLVRHMKDDEDAGHGFANRLLRVVTLITVALTVIAVLAAPWIVKIYATSEYGQRELSVATLFAVLCLPQIIFYGLYTMFGQILNARGHFAAPMFAPIANNIVVILACLYFIYWAGDSQTVATITDEQIVFLGAFTTLGVVIQAVILIPVLRRNGFRFAYVPGLRGFGLGHAGRLAIWTIGLVLINQLGFIVVVRLATLANVLAQDDGTVAQGLATYQMALLVFMLPHSVITISIVTALMPRMSRAAADHDLAKVSAFVAEGARLVSALIVPCAVALLVCGPALTTVIFGQGAGAGEASTYTGIVVMGFAVGLLPFSVFYTLLRGWYAIEDTRTPFFLTLIYNVVMIGLSIPLFLMAPVWLKVTALAVGYAVAYWIILGLAWFMLGRRLGGLQTRQSFGVLLRLGVAAILAGCAGLAVNLSMVAAFDAPYGFTNRTGLALVNLVLAGLVVAVVFFGVAAGLRVSEVREVFVMVRGKLPGAH